MKIALTFTGSNKKHFNYENWLKADESVEIVKLSADDHHLKDIQKCDGLVLSGGVDIHPRFYGSSVFNYPNADNFNEKRDEFEIEVFRLAMEKRLPVLGICRGLQLINCILGGNLRQDLGIDLNKVHRGNPDKRHAVEIQSSLLLEIAGATTGEVNSSHHQAIDQMGEGLVVNCRSSDETIEGIEWRDKAGKPFLLAVQWHPERMGDKDTNTLSRNVKERFMEEIRKA